MKVGAHRLIAAPACTAQAFAPLLFGLLLDAVGVGAIAVSDALCLVAFTALLCLRASPPRAPPAT